MASSKPDPKGVDWESMSRGDPTTLRMPTDDERTELKRLFAHNLDLARLVNEARAEALCAESRQGKKQSVRLVRVTCLSITPIPWRQKHPHWVLSVDDDDGFDGTDYHFVVDPRPSAIATAPCRASISERATPDP